MTQSNRRPYRNWGRNSPIRFYALGPSFIRIWFDDGGCYEYDNTRPGNGHVATMKRLAEEGRGLATYINQHVSKNYARKL